MVFTRAVSARASVAVSGRARMAVTRASGIICDIISAMEGAWDIAAYWAYVQSRKAELIQF